MIQNLLCDREDIELTIQELNGFADKLEDLRDRAKNSFVRSETERFITEVEKDIEWNEQLKEEIIQSIEFEERK